MFAKCSAKTRYGGEIAHVAELLMGGKGGFITGADFLIDGEPPPLRSVETHDSKKTSQTIENGRQSTK